MRSKPRFLLSLQAVQYGLSRLVIILLIHSTVLAQELFREAFVPDDPAKTQLLSLAISPDGLITIGTSNGFILFDGLEDQLFELPDSITGTGITALAWDQSGCLWLGNGEGMVARWHRWKGVDVFLPGDDSNRHVSGILPVNDTLVYASVYGSGLFRIHPGRQGSKPVADGFINPYIYSILQSGDFLIAATENGLVRCPVSGDKITVYTPAEGMPDQIVTSLAKGTSGLVWFGTYGGGIGNIDFSAGRIELFASTTGITEISSITPSGGKLWFISRNKDLFRLDPSEDMVAPLSGCSKTQPELREIISDNDDYVWILSNKNLCFSYGERLKIYERDEAGFPGQITALTPAIDRGIWVADNKGVYHLTGLPDSGGEKPEFVVTGDQLNGPVSTLWQHRSGVLWMGSLGEGVLLADPNSSAIRHLTTDDGLANNNILSIEGRSDTVWLSTLGGLSRVILHGKRFEIDNLDRSNGLENTFIYDMALGRGSKLYLATDGSGIITYDGDRFERFPGFVPGNHDVAYSVETVQKDNIWTILAGKGLFRAERNLLTEYPAGKVLPNQMTGLAINPGNELVVAFQDGIAVMDMKNYTTRIFGDNAGLSGFSPYLNAIVTDIPGNIWAGGNGKLVRYSSTGRQTQGIPHIFLKEIRVLNSPADSSKAHKLHYNENYISFSFSGIWYTNPEMVRYRYRLDPLDPDWIETGDKSVFYNNLPPGEYTFRVHTVSHPNSLMTDETHYSFVIRPPLWKQPWFIILVILLLITGITWLIIQRDKRIRARQQREQQQIRLRFNQLKNHLNPHFLFNSLSTLTALIESDPEQAVEYVDELAGLFRSILEYRDVEVVTLDREIQIVQNYLALQRRRYGDHVRVAIEIEPGLERWLLPPLTLQMLIENAIKHNIATGDEPLNISVSGCSNRGYLFVENNLNLRGEKAPSTGTGLQNIREQFLLLTDREIIIEETANKFLIGIPLIKPEK